MHVYRTGPSNNRILRASKRDDSLGTYVGTDAGWSDAKKRFPKWSGTEVIVNQALENAYQSTELARQKANKKDEIESQYAIQSGSDHTFTTNGKAYQTDGESQLRINHGITYLNTGESTIEWTAADNTRSTITAANFKLLGKEIFERNQSHYVTLRSKKSDVDAATTVASVTAYDATTGW